MMALVAWAAGSAALSVAFYPPLAASLFAFLVGVVIVMTLRTTLRTGLLVAAAVVPLFLYAQLTMVAVGADPTFGDLGPGALLRQPAVRQLDVWSLGLLGAAILLASSGVAEATSAMIGRIAPAPHVGAPAEAGTREPGIERVEREVARATAHRRPMALALIGLDGPGGLDADRAMADLDRLVPDTLGRFDVVATYGSRERLVALPEQTTESFAAGAGALCRQATARLGRHVRAALVEYPAHGSLFSELVAELEAGLAACRAAGETVRVGPVRSRLAATPRAS